MNMIVTYAAALSKAPKANYNFVRFQHPGEIVEEVTYCGLFPFLNLEDADKHFWRDSEGRSVTEWYTCRPHGLFVIAPRMIDPASVDLVYACWKRKIFGNISMKRVRACMFAANSNGKLFQVFDVGLNEVSPATLKTALSVDYYPGIQEEMSEKFEQFLPVAKPTDISPLDRALRNALAKVGVPQDPRISAGELTK